MSAPSGPFQALPPQVDLPALEHEVLEQWEADKVFARSLEGSADRPQWVFYEGPPTANGRPGTHHIEARAFKDVFPRFKTMQGYSVPRRAGWDCHGLPVEIAVEQELGFAGKPDIERYGIAEFNARCRESVERHVGAFAELTQRMGYWVDMSTAYRTMDASYIESVWWSLQQVFDKGLLVEDHRVAPYCPRCGTGLSDHEVAQGYETLTDPSVYVRLPVTSGEWAGKADLLIWTTTPWTLPSNTAVAVHPDVTYVVARTDDGTFVVAEPLLAAALGENAKVLARTTGRDWERVHYQRPFELVDFPEGDAHFVVLAEYVTTEDGTGLVHQSPAFGADDFTVCRSYGLPVVNPIDATGHFTADVPLVGGHFFKAADPTLVQDLQDRGVLYREMRYEHSYPHCWRCHTPLMYYAQPSWYIRTSQVKDQLLAQNERTNWYPENIKEGRFGDWLNNNVDWALSRDRYWGTPLPIWRNDADPSRMVVVGSLAELSELTGRDLSDLDPHRPFIDEVTFTVPGEEGTYRRVRQVIDAWYDSGSMPFAQWGAPHRNKAEFEAAYPAQFIAEAIDQTRGWFYTLMAVGTLVFEQSSYENVLCLGHILAEDGRKMSKHLGNILEPMPLMDRHGADAVRWFMLAGGSPWSARRVGHETLSEVVRKVLLTYWNTASFFTLYAETNGWDPAVAPAPPRAERPLLDRWALAELASVTAGVTDALEQFDTQTAGRLIAEFVDDLSNWYVRRSRRRFWDGDPAALGTLHEVLDGLTRLMAPFTPFVTERVWRGAVVPGAADAVDSVHLASWPAVDTDARDDALVAQVALVRRLVELGRSARTAGKARTRQPLARALVAAPGWAQLPRDLVAEVAEELNVAELTELAAVDGSLVDVSVKVDFRAVGRRMGKQVQAVAAAVAAADAAELVAAYRAGTATVPVDGAEVPLVEGDLVITETPREGWTVASGGGLTVALDLTLTPELERAGLVREVVRLVQDARKSSGLAVSDRIEVRWTGEGAIAQALTEHAAQLSAEVLATAVHAQQTGDGDGLEGPAGARVWITPAS
ncbi:isoleucine--tRNA ligase [Modestobacter sp. VKM Ac-2979]|uniref:isoleucine--tRNA ligase n=1 Tax=unclassified Modestobacter TaxID=2643866 RepID=UPI0022ABC529|nr:MULTISPECIES: isoleucine--tRNA ligase [unclassified Modestobacter]MCZ2812944.1 isoleucine--tRNA ligase [Modestobacter sp. VKM Ac-2979]MCZ2843027.1 isoleucine--tRNA ligase [Modestobacter sp. VKM Ac-2980]